MKVELLYFPDCPHVQAARANLGAALGPGGAWVEVDISAPEHAHRAGYGSPAVLVDGVDVSGGAPGDAACCRVYAADGRISGAPSVESIARALGSARRGRLRTVLAGGATLVGIACPALGVLCPACWPAWFAAVSALVAPLSSGTARALALGLFVVAAGVLVNTGAGAGRALEPTGAAACGIAGCKDACAKADGCGGARPAAELCDDTPSESRCTAYRACAIGVDLSVATGARLARYRQQKAEDGKTFRDVAAPDFILKDLKGSNVSLGDFRGRRVALVFWQSHCSHSMKSLPVWDALRKELGDRVAIVTVLFNGGDAAYVRTWYEPMGYGLPVLLASDDRLAEAYGSHLVPSVFLVDERGQLVKKLVTQQEPEVLRRELAVFARS